MLKAYLKRRRTRPTRQARKPRTPATPQARRLYPEQAPRLLPLGGVLDADAATRPTGCHRYLLGVDTDGTSSWWDPTLSGDLQLVSASNRGKTNLLRVLVLQALRAGVPNVYVLTGQGAHEWDELSQDERVRIVSVRAHAVCAPSPRALLGARALNNTLASLCRRAQERWDEGELEIHEDGSWGGDLIVIDDLRALEDTLASTEEGERRLFVFQRHLAHLLEVAGARTGTVIVTSSHDLRRGLGVGPVRVAPIERGKFALGMVSPQILLQAGGRELKGLLPTRSQDPGRWLITDPCTKSHQAVASPHADGETPQALRDFARRGLQDSSG